MNSLSRTIRAAARPSQARSVAAGVRRAAIELRRAAVGTPLQRRNRILAGLQELRPALETRVAEALVSGEGVTSAVVDWSMLELSYSGLSLKGNTRVPLAAYGIQCLACTRRRRRESSAWLRSVIGGVPSSWDADLSVAVRAIAPAPRFRANLSPYGERLQSAFSSSDVGTLLRLSEEYFVTYHIRSRDPWLDVTPFGWIPVLVLLIRERVFQLDETAWRDPKHGRWAPWKKWRPEGICERATDPTLLLAVQCASELMKSMPAIRTALLKAEV